VNSRAELESYKVANVVENSFAFLNRRPNSSVHMGTKASCARLG